MSIFLYHIFLWLYRSGIRLIMPWNPKARRWVEGRRGIFERIAAEMSSAEDLSRSADGKRPLIWMHCASLGEFEQGRPVLEALRRLSPEKRILVTFFSPSGFETRKNYTGADHVFYLPLDNRRNARRFIDLVQPQLVLWVKYDYWYYYLLELKKRNIPLLLISAAFRQDQPFFRWYGRLHRYMLECFTHLFVQTAASAKLLAGLGITENVSVSGDTRYDSVIDIAGHSEPMPLIEAFCEDRQVIIAGSTWEEDEEELDHYANTHPEIRFIIAPHEVEEERIREVEGLFRYRVRYSVWAAGAGGEEAASDGDGEAASDGNGEAASGKLQAASGKPRASSGQGRKGSAGAGGEGGKWIKERTAYGMRPPNVLIIDNVGLLSRIYRYATIAYVGGGFGDDGVHNVLEAAVYGKPVVCGPVIEKYVEAVELVDAGGGIVVDSALDAESVFNRLLAGGNEYEHACKASREYVLARKGATEKIVGYIAEMGMQRQGMQR
jgi:3-deoxy-D-manno-octulosonic-acid transferase